MPLISVLFMLLICCTFIILFTLKRIFPYRDDYRLLCKKCDQAYHHSRIGHDGICERCFLSAAAASDGFALRGRCIDALDDGTVDPDDL